MTKITLQHIFNLAWDHFVVNDGPPGIVRRGMPGSEATYRCCYLNPETGAKCAVGLALPDGHPAQQSPLDFASVVNEYPDLFDESVHAMLGGNLANFQYMLHDSMLDMRNPGWVGDCNTQEARAAQYRKVAHIYNLTIPGE